MNAFAYSLSPFFRSANGRAFTSHPPCNVESDGENTYVVSLAVAGYDEDDLEVSVQRSRLSVTGRAKDPKSSAEGSEAGAGHKTLYRGITLPAFERHFDLADHVRAQNVWLKNGMLHVALLKEVPEPLRRQVLPIGAARASEPAPSAPPESSKPPEAA